MRPPSSSKPRSPTTDAIQLQGWRTAAQALLPRTTPSPRLASPGRGLVPPAGGGRRVCHGAPATSAPVDHASRTGADGAEAPVAVGGGIPRERVRPRRSLVRRPQQPAAGSATSHPNSASESTNRTKSACREMDCFW